MKTPRPKFSAIFIFLACSVFILSLTSNLSAQNLLTNPGFETGTLTGWTRSGTLSSGTVTAPVYAGTYSAFIATAGATGSKNLFQNVNVYPGKRYNFTGYVYLDGTTTQGAGLTLALAGDGMGATLTTSNSTMTTVSNATWAYLQLSTVCPTGNNIYGINITMCTNGTLAPWSTGYFDDVSFAAAPAPPAVTGFAAAPGSAGGQINLSWVSPAGSAGYGDPLAAGSTFYIQYASWTGVAFSTATQPPVGGYDLSIPTGPVTAGTSVYFTLGGLTDGVTYYFRIWTKDAAGQWSNISLGAAAWAKSGVAGDPPGTYAGDFNQAGGAVYSKGFDYAYRVAVDTISGGGPFVYAVGVSTFNNKTEYIAIKYNSAGVVVSSAAVVKNQISQYSEIPGIAVRQQDNCLYLMTQTSSPATGTDLVIHKYDLNLVFLSSTVYAGPYDEFGFGGISIDGGGNVFVTGENNQSQWVAWKYSPALVFLSSAAWSFVGPGDAGVDVACAPDGYVYMLGLGWDGGNQATMRYITAKCDGALNMVSSATYYTGGGDFSRALAYKNGNIYVTGASSGKVVTIRYSDSLAMLSSATFVGGVYAEGNGVSVGPAGEVYVAGRLDYGADSDMVVLKYTSGLSFVSSVAYNSGFYDSAEGVAVGVSSYAYVAGHSRTGVGDADMRILRFVVLGDVGDAVAPAAVTDLAAQPGSAEGEVRLTWSAPGDDGWTSPLSAGSVFKIQRSTAVDGTGDAKPGWSYQSAQILVSTSGVVPTTQVSHVVTGLAVGATFYFKIWHADEVPNWSNLSNSATSWAQVPQSGLWRSVQSGNWSAGATWDKGTSPISLSVVQISHTVTFNMFEAECSTVNVMNFGTLQFDGAISSRALVVGGNLEIMNGGKFLMPPNTGYISALKIKCNGPAEYGIIVNNGGVFDVQGNTTTTPSTRNALITSANPANKTYIRNFSQSVGGFNMYYVEVASAGVGVAGKYGITFDGPGTSGRVSGCTIHDGFAGIYLYKSSSNTLSANDMYALGAWGIYLSSGSHNNNLSDNHIYSGDVGIMINGSSGNTLSNNIIHGHTNDNIFLDSNSNGNTIVGNTCYSGLVGITVGPGCLDNIVAGNTCYLNDSGVVVDGGSGILFGNTLYLNSNYGAWISGSPAPVSIMDCVMGKSGGNASDVGYSPSYSVGVTLKNCDLYSSTKVNAADINVAGSYLVSYNQNDSTGAVQIWGDYNIPNGKADKFNYTDVLYLSTATQPNSTLKGAGAITYPTTDNNKTLTEFWEIKCISIGPDTFSVKRGTGAVLYEDTPPTVTGGGTHISNNTGVTFTVNAGSYQVGDAFYFVTISSSADQNVQKRIEFNPSPVGTKLTVTAGGALEMVGTPAYPTISTSAASGAYYGLYSSGTLKLINYSVSNTSSTGLSIYAGNVIDLSSGTFNNIQAAVSPSSSAYINVSGITSNATFYGCVFNDAPGTANYNIKANGSGINWTFRNWSGPKGGPAYTATANGATIVWEGAGPVGRIWSRSNALGAGLASNSANWSPSGSPQNGDAVYFNATSTQSCNWDVAVALSSVTMTAGYTGQVNFSTGIFVSGNVTKTGGSLAIGNTKFELAGDFTNSAGALSAGTTGKIVFSGNSAQRIDSPGMVTFEVGSSSEVVNIASSFMSVNGSVFISSGIFRAGNEIRVGGDWTQDGGLFDAQASTVAFDSINLAQNITALPGNPFNHFKINSTTYVYINSPVTANGVFTLAAGTLSFVSGGKLDVAQRSEISGGRFEVRNGTFSATGLVEVLSGGVLDLSVPGGNSTLRLAAGIALSTGGALLSDSAGDVITWNGSYYKIKVNGGYAGIYGITLDHSAGVELDAVAGGSFDNVKFVNLLGGAAALSILAGGTSVYIFRNHDFDATVSTNVSAPYVNWPGYIIMENATGARSGPAFEKDPNNVVFWSTPTAAGAFDGVSISTSEIKWSWTDTSADERGYKIRNSTFGVIADLPQNTTEFVLAGLTPNASAAVLVEAYNPIGASTAAFVTRYSRAAVPSGLYLTNVTSNAATLNWSPDGNPAGTFYDAEFSTSPDFTPYGEVYGTVALTADCTGLLANTTYYFRANARNFNSINTGYSAVVSTRTPSGVSDVTPPAASIVEPPNNSYRNALGAISGTAADDTQVAEVRVRIRHNMAAMWWNSAGQAFDIDDSSSESAWFVAASSSANFVLWATTQATNNLVDGVQYTVVAKARDSSNNWSLAYSSAVFGYDVQKPTGAVTYPANDSFIKTLASIVGTSGDSASGVADVKIAVRRLSDGMWWSGASFNSAGIQALGVTPPLATWTFTGLSDPNFTANTSYYATIRITDIAGNVADWGVHGSTFTFDNSSPTTPSLTSPANNAAISSTTIFFDWTDSTDYSGITKYELRISTDVNFSIVNFSSDTAISQSTVPAVFQSAYYWKVRPLDGAGNYGAWSSTYSLVVDTSPPSSVGFASVGAVSSTVIITTPTASDSLAGLDISPYYIQRSTDGVLWGNYDSGWVSSSHTWTGLSPNTTYFFRVKARDKASNESGYSSVWTKSTLANPPSGSAFAGVWASSFTITWSANGNPSWNKYIVEYDSSSPYDFGPADGASGWLSVTTHTFYGLASSATHYVRVYTKNADDIYEYSSPVSTVTPSPSDVTPPSVPPPVDPVNASASSIGNIFFDWTDSTDASGIFGYELVISSDVNFGVVNHSSAPTVSSATIYGIKSGWHWWKVRAKDNANNYSTYSSTYSLLIDTVAPVNVGLTLTGVFSSSITVSTGNLSATDELIGLAGVPYYIQMSTDGASWGNYDSGWVSSFTYSGLTADTTYWLRVKARDSLSNESAYISPISNITRANPPAGSYLTNVTSYSVTVNWSPSGNPAWTQYSVIRDTEPTFSPTYWSSAWVSTTNFTFAGLTASTSQYFKVYARNGDGISTDYDATVSTVTLAPPPPTFEPDSYITAPPAGGYYKTLPTLSGTALALTAGATIQKVELEIKNVTDNTYWNGSSWVGAQGWAATSYSSPTWTYASPAWASGKQYSVTARATDSNSDVETTLPSVSFVYDTQPPVSGVVYPVSGGAYAALAALSGTTNPNLTNEDNCSPVAAADVRLWRSSDGNYWDGSSWVAVSSWLAANVVSSVTWSYAGALPSWTSGYYGINVRTADAAGNYQVGFATTTFYITAPASRLVLTLPGETFVAGSAPGKSGAPSNQTAGAAFMITARAVDDNYFVDASTNATVTVTTDDPYDTHPSPAALTSGAGVFNVTLVAAGTTQITISAAALAGDTTSVYVACGAASKLQILVPGETAAPGSPTGKTGAPTARTAGVTFNASVNLTDNYWNKVNLNEPLVKLTTTDPYDTEADSQTLVGGMLVFGVTLVKATVSTVTAQDVDGIGPLYAAAVSAGITVNPAASAKLLIIVPGESFEPGSAVGKIGSPSNQVSGQAFSVTVRATDAWWNLNTAGVALVNIITSDPSDVHPSDAALVSGEKTFSINFAGPGSWTVCATDMDGSPLDSSTSTAVNVLDGTPPAAVPDLSAQPGSVDGGVALAWSAPGDNGWTNPLPAGSKFAIQYSTWPGVIWSTAAAQVVVSTSGASPTTAVSRVITGLTGWTTYYFTIWHADDAPNWSGLSNTATAYARDLAGPSAPSLSSPPGATATNNPSATFSWSASSDGGSGVAGYEFYISTASDFSVFSSSAYSAPATLNLTLAQAQYYWRVRAVDNAGNYSSYSVSYSLIIDTQQPTMPALASPSDGATVGSAADFQWVVCTDNLSGIKEYKLEIAVDPDFGAIIITTSAAGNLVNVSGLTDGNRWWRVYSLDNAGNYSTPSSTRSIVVVGSAPAAPTGLSAVVLSTVSICWSWQDVATNETGYRIYNQIDEIMAALAADTTFYIETGLSPNTSYTRRVRAYNNAGSSSKSNDVAKYTLANPPSNPSSPSQTATSITLSWTAGAGGNSRFYVERSTDGVVFSPIITWTSAKVEPSLTDASGIKPDTTYYYKVGGYNGDAALTALAGPLAVKSAVVPPETIAGKVTQANGAPIAAIRVEAVVGDESSGYFVHTSTDGTYLISGVAAGKYRVRAKWALNDIVSSAYKDDISNGSVNVDFTLEVSFVPATIAGVIQKVSSDTDIARASPSNKYSPASSDSPYVEILKDGAPALRIAADHSGYYEIKNLMPGKYILRAFNGLSHSAASEISVGEGQTAMPSFKFAPIPDPDADVYAYPNPAAGGLATIRFKAGVASPKIDLKIYNLAAELVRTADESDFAASSGGIYKFNWNLENSSGGRLASGVYIYVLKVSAGGVETVVKKKIAIIK